MYPKEFEDPGIEKSLSKGKIHDHSLCTLTKLRTIHFIVHDNTGLWDHHSASKKRVDGGNNRDCHACMVGRRDVRGTWPKRWVSLATDTS